MPSSTIPASGGGGLTPKYVKYTSSGTFTLPDGYGAAKPLLITIQVIGGGGAGASLDVSSQSSTRWGYGNWQDYFGSYSQVTLASSVNTTNSSSTSLAAGGSGGLAQTQMYLTSNLTFTVGAAGARNNTGLSGAPSNTNTLMITNMRNASGTPITLTAVGGTGGISQAGVVKAGGGTGEYVAVSYFWSSNNSQSVFTSASNGSNSNSNNGAGGTPSGTAGSATPLLGTLAGGSASTTAVNGSFGVGGIQSDGATSTGSDGTGGGHNSAGASGAVIITYWS